MNNNPNKNVTPEQENENQTDIKKQNPISQETPVVSENQQNKTSSLFKNINTKKILIPSLFLVILLLIGTSVYLYFNPRKTQNTPVASGSIAITVWVAILFTLSSCIVLATIGVPVTPEGAR